MRNKNNDHLNYASWIMECGRHNVLSFWVIFCPYTILFTPKIKLWKNVKKPWTHYPFTYVYHNWRSYDVWFLTYKARQSFCHFGSSFALWTSEQFKKSKFWKNQYNTWRYYHFTLVYHKWQSYGVWFLRYGAQQTEFFVILDNFLPFYRTYNWKNKNFEKTKTILGEILSFYTCVTWIKIMMYDSWDTERDRQIFF